MKKLYYFLVCGEVSFVTPDEQTGQVRLNGVIAHEKDTFPVRMIGKAQQTLQLNFFKQINDPKVTVIDVVLLHVSNLGRMTEEDFHAAPEGMKVQEKVEPNNPFGSEVTDLTAAVADNSTVN